MKTKIVGWLFIIASAFFIFGGLLGFLMVGDSDNPLLTLILTVFSFIFGIYNFILGSAIKAHKPWSYIAGLITISLAGLGNLYVLTSGGLLTVIALVINAFSIYALLNEKGLFELPDTSEAANDPFTPQNSVSLDQVSSIPSWRQSKSSSTVSDLFDERRDRAGLNIIKNFVAPLLISLFFNVFLTVGGVFVSMLEDGFRGPVFSEQLQWMIPGIFAPTTGTLISYFLVFLVLRPTRKSLALFAILLPALVIFLFFFTILVETERKNAQWYQTHPNWPR